MRRLVLVLIASIVVLAGCTGGDEELPEGTQLSLSSLGVDWPSADGTLDVVDPPAVPDGFDEGRYGRMVEALTAWATASTVDPTVRESAEPSAVLAERLPDAIAREIAATADDSVSPRLVVANVFAPEVEVVGAPLVTTAWSSEPGDDDGAPALTLTLQTRAAYQVRVGDGPLRVIGVLRTHTLITREGETGGIGVGFGFREFGASDCALAVDDALRPQTDADAAREDLETFLEVGDSDEVSMPDLGDEDEVDQAYLDRCERGTT